MYDQEVAYTAIDAGADLVLGHHSYLKGIEVYKGKAIFHSLGLFVPARLEQTAEQTKKQHSLDNSNVSDVFSIRPYPAPYPYRQLTMIAKCTTNGGKISRLSYIPCFVNEQKQPEPLGKDERGQQVFDFMDKITAEAGLKTRYQWEGDEIAVNATD
jgi:poly-gamma-glutamate synthesis protein (capsule biosynthesis protein)